MKKIALNSLILDKTNILSHSEKKTLFGGFDSSQCWCVPPGYAFCEEPHMSCAELCEFFVPGDGPCVDP